MWWKIEQMSLYTKYRRQEGALTLRLPTFRPLMSTTQSLRPQNVTTQIRPDHVTLSPKSGRIVRPTKIVQPQKIGGSVTVEHYDPLLFWPAHTL